MNISINIDTCTANATTVATLTISGAQRDQWAEAFGWIWSTNSAVTLSLDGTHFSDEVSPTDNGTYTLYIKAGNIITSQPVVFHEFYAGNDDWQEGHFDIDFVRGEPGSDPGFSNISLTLNPRQITTQYNASTVNTPNTIGDTIVGTLLDHHYSWEVERIAEQGAQKVLNGSAFSTKLTQTLINYQIEYDFSLSSLGWVRPTFREHLDKIENEIHIPINLIGDDFYPKSDINIMLHKNIGQVFEYVSGTFSEVISRLIGWSADCPSLTYNIYIENGEIYIVQQGHEQNTRTPSAWEITPTITHTRRRTQWADSQYQTLIPKEISSSDAANSNTPFSGTLTWGTTTLVYDDGYLIREERGDDGQGGATFSTVYEYTTYGESKYLRKKTTTDSEANTYTETVYEYESTGVDYYLFEEKTDVYSGPDIAHGFLQESTVTRHTPIGGGWYGVSVYDASSGTEEERSTNITQGAPGNKATQFTIDAQNDSLKPSGSQRQVTVPLNGVAKARQQFPVANRDAFSGGLGLRTIATALDTYEDCEEITLAGSIVGESHLYNYNDVIVYNGNQYHLVSNQVTQTPSAIRQNITAVRWVV